MTGDNRFREYKVVALDWLLGTDDYAQFNTGFIVYHDDVGDYSTNEPIMDGTANLTYLFAAMTRP